MRKCEIAAICTIPVDGGLTYVRGDAATPTMPDVMALVWWCHKANIERIAGTYDNAELRIGRGLAFHDCAS
jgi:hypothetical protein